MNKENEERLDAMLKTIKESTINIVDSKEINPEVLRAEIYRKGLIYLSNPNDIQNIIDIGVLGLSIIMRK